MMKSIDEDFFTKCDFELCVNENEGRCTDLIDYKKCKYRQQQKILDSILATQKFCSFCKNNMCKNSTTGDAACEPIVSIE